MGGLDFCRELKQKSVYDSPRVILLTGGETSSEEGREAGADSVLRKPFSPLDLLGAIDRVLEGKSDALMIEEAASSDQLLAYARDLSEVVQVERAQRRLLQQAYRQTISAFSDSLEARHRTTGHHALRVHRYALELTNEPTAYESAFRRLAATNLSDLDPPRVVYALLFTHPTPAERLAAIDAARS
jgi:DNA-binding response OmpR family regulator